VPMLLLGAKTGTKSRREQSAVLLHLSGFADMLIRAFKSSTPPGCRLTTISSVGAYNACLRKAQKSAKLGWLHATAHSPRAGWASELRLAGVEFTELRERGRWVSDSSLRMYLDAVTAHYLTIRLQGVMPQFQLLMADFAHRYMWWPGSM
jgi:hypothetical protein